MEKIMLIGCRVFISYDLWSRDGIKLLKSIEKHYTSDYKVIFSKTAPTKGERKPSPIAIDFKSQDIARDVFTLLTLTELKLIYEQNET